MILGESQLNDVNKKAGTVAFAQKSQELQDQQAVAYSLRMVGVVSLTKDVLFAVTLVTFLL